MRCSGLIYTIISFFVMSGVAHGQDSRLERFDGFDTISGPLPSLVRSQKRPYLVISNIEVPPQKTVTIEPGTVFLFRNFSGLHIRGRLLARATESQPIIFTSEFDQSVNPNSRRNANPFDWDGIYMTSDALGSQLIHCKLKYSVYGLLSDTKLIRLDPVEFRDNGKEWITIENEDIPVSNDLFIHVLDKNDPLLQSAAINLMRDPLYAKRTVLRISSIGGILAGLCMTGVFGYSLFRSEKSLRSLSDKNEFKNLNRNHGSIQWETAYKKRNRDNILTAGGTLLMVTSIVGFRYTFTF